jgi:hypothetical protein
MKKISYCALPGYIWKNIRSPFSMPFYKRVRDSFGVLLLLIIAEITSREWNHSYLTIVSRKMDVGILTRFPNGDSLKAGILSIDQPDLTTLLFSDQDGRASFSTLLLLAVISVIIIFISPKLSDQQLFRKDISRSIRWVGILITLHFAILEFYAKSHINRLVVSVTDGQYDWTQHGFNSMILAEGYIGLIIFAAGGLYRKGVVMREEQDLTI